MLESCGELFEKGFPHNKIMKFLAGLFYKKATSLCGINKLAKVKP